MSIFLSNQEVEERILDYDDLKRQGIAIWAKNTSINYSGANINIVDTPERADFSGQVKKMLSMVDGALLLVGPCEGPALQVTL